MTFLTLTNSSDIVLIDQEDFEKCAKYSWHLTGENKQIRNTGGQFLVHFILGSGKWDHKDRNPLNNQKENLRLANNSQNGANRDKYKLDGSSDYKGVSYCKRDKCWRAYIKVKQKGIALGTFKTEIDAAKAYDKAAVVYFKEFAVLNFSESV